LDFVSDSPEPAHKGRAELFPKTWERLQARLAEIERESVEESLRNLLFDGKNYLFPGQLLIPSKLPNPPLPPEFGREDIDLLLSNRRIMKLLTDLESLPRDQAEDLLVKYLDEGLERYREMYEALVSGTGQSQAEYAGGLVIGNLADGSPSLNSARMNVLALAFLAGQFQVSDAHPILLQMALDAQQQRNTYYEAASGGVPGSATHGIRYVSLYNRQILAYALAATSGNGLSAAEVLAQWSVHTRNEPLPPWNAPVGPRDSIVFKDPAIPDANGLEVTYIAFITDSLYDEILAAFANL
jgi:hypothetical protein